MNRDGPVARLAHFTQPERKVMPADAHRVKPEPEAITPMESPLQEMKAAFNVGRKISVTPRDGEPTELCIRQFYSDQLFDVIDAVEKVWTMAQELANPEGDLDLFELFKTCKEEAMTLIAKAIDQDRKSFVGKLEFDDLLAVFLIVFEVNKDFFDQRVKAKIQKAVELISTIS